MSLPYRVEIAAPTDRQFDPKTHNAVWWNVHSTYNSGWRPSDALWLWFRSRAIEVTDWCLEASEDASMDAPVVFSFHYRADAVRFALEWK